jgi:hypothetical protein
MFFKFYKGNSPSVIILIVITGIVLWLPGFFTRTHSPLPFDHLQMPFFKYIFDLLGNSVTAKLVAQAILIITGFYLNRLNSEYGFLKERTQLPALIFIVVNSAFILLQRLTPALFAGLLFLLAIEKIFLSYRKENLSYNFFEASFIISLATFFYLPMLFLWPVIFIALVLLRPVIWREWVLSFMGLLLPFILFFSIQFIRLGEIESTYILLIDQFSIVPGGFSINIATKIFLGFLVLFILLGSILIINTMQSRKIFSRKVFLYLFWIFLFSIGSFFVIENTSLEIILFASIPFSFLLSEYFLYRRNRRWKNGLFFLFLLSGLVSAYSMFFL